MAGFFPLQMCLFDFFCEFHWCTESKSVSLLTPPAPSPVPSPAQGGESPQVASLTLGLQLGGQGGACEHLHRTGAQQGQRNMGLGQSTQALCLGFLVYDMEMK